MWGDRVLEEVRAVREAHATRFDCDLQAIVEDLRKREATSGHLVIQPGNSQDNAIAAPNQPLHQTNRKAGALVSSGVRWSSDRRAINGRRLTIV